MSRAWPGGKPSFGKERYGKASCECQNRDAHPVTLGNNLGGCEKSGLMWDGRFLCRGCKKHTWDPGDTETPEDYTKRTGRAWEDRA